MTQKNSLLEWVEQTRRINKRVDIISMSVIDSIIDHGLPYLRKSFLVKNKKFFNKFCDYYHKDHPLDLHKKLKPISKRDCGFCIPMEHYVQESIDRSWDGIEMVKIRWMEIVDMLWERPELVNPSILDDYVRLKISEVCKEKNKKNPLSNGMWNHFGKHWRGKDGKWHPERRKRV